MGSFSRNLSHKSLVLDFTHILRKQIGATVLSVTEDAVFVIREGQSLKKIRAEKLEPGMVLATGEKVYR